MEELHGLMKLIMGLDEDFPSTQELLALAAAAMDHLVEVPILLSDVSNC